MAEAARRVRRILPVLLATLLAALLAPPLPAQTQAPEPAQLLARTVEPRAFGHRLGDVVERQVIVEVPSRLKLDEASLPTPGPQGPVLELRSMARTWQPTATGQRLTLRLHYQVFAAPVSVRTYELPKLQLRFDGLPRAEEQRIEPWPLVVAALAAEDASAREGLGELRPDIAPPLRDTALERTLLWACAAVATLLAAYLAFVYFGLPWWGRQQRPFTQALRAVQAQGAGDTDWRAAWRAMHAAFDQTAGRTLFADAVDGFVARQPRFAALKGDIEQFFQHSQAAFFNEAPWVPRPQREWLLAFARACRDAERGSA